MSDIRDDLVRRLRAMAAQGEKASAMARAVIAAHPIEPFDRFLFSDYFRAAFCFWEGGTGPLFGWLPDGTDYLSDAELDNLMAPLIAKTRPEWGAAERLPAA